MFTETIIDLAKKGYKVSFNYEPYTRSFKLGVCNSPFEIHRLSSEADIDYTKFDNDDKETSDFILSSTAIALANKIEKMKCLV